MYRVQVNVETLCCDVSVLLWVKYDIVVQNKRRSDPFPWQQCTGQWTLITKQHNFYVLMPRHTGTHCYRKEELRILSFSRESEWMSEKQMKCLMGRFFDTNKIWVTLVHLAVFSLCFTNISVFFSLFCSLFHSFFVDFSVFLLFTLALFNFVCLAIFSLFFSRFLEFHL